MISLDTCKQGAPCLCRLIPLCGSLLVYNLLYGIFRVLAFQDRRSHVWCFYLKKCAMFVRNGISENALLLTWPARHTKISAWSSRWTFLNSSIQCGALCCCVMCPIHFFCSLIVPKNVSVEKRQMYFYDALTWTGLNIGNVWFITHHTSHLTLHALVDDSHSKCHILRPHLAFQCLQCLLCDTLHMVLLNRLRSTMY